MCDYAEMAKFGIVSKPGIAIDGKVKQRSITQAAAFVEINPISQIRFGFSARFAPTLLTRSRPDARRLSFRFQTSL